jgi:hypothetical protein
MPTIIITGLVLFSVLVGGTLYVYKPKLKYVLTIVAMALVGFLGLGMGAAYSIGLNAAQTGAVSGYDQYLNGTVVAVPPPTQVVCTRDGSCVHTERCDKYVISYAYTDKNGNYHPEVDGYHQCPIATVEYTDYVKYSTRPDGSHQKILVIADHRFAANPVHWSEWGGVDWTDSWGTPSFGDVPRGAPAVMAQWRRDIAAGNAPSITVQDTYDNYILASEGTILRAYSGDINKLLRLHLLPDHTANMTNPIYGYLNAAKMQFVCMPKPVNAAAWESALMHFNSALGTHLQGDMHVLAIRSSCLSKAGVSTEDALNAVQAYWLNELGKDAIAKNGIILLLGVDDSGSTIQWAKAATGMPIGNNVMLQMLQSALANVSFSPAAVFGNTTATIVNVKGTLTPRYTLGKGVVPNVVMVQQPFKRACMKCESASDKAKGEGGQGFVYLQTEIPLAGTTLVVTDILYVISMLILWGVVFVGVIPHYAIESPFKEPSRQSGRGSSSSIRFRY